MALNPDKDLKLFYSISEVAKELNVKESMLRYWEKEFSSVLKPHKTAKGTRQYKKEDMDVIRRIHYLVKVKGMTIQGARHKLKGNPDGVAQNAEVVKRLQSIKEELLKIKNELEHL